ncbi:hypothetical protein J6590_102170 [Homalodisca vitripennis]|nr:hypothetical protein J6590_102170 [Homalodisca vitripennis]
MGKYTLEALKTADVSRIRKAEIAAQLATKESRIKRRRLRLGEEEVDDPHYGPGTRGRDTYRTGSHRTGVYEHLPSQAGIRFLNKLPNSIINAPTLKAFKARLKRFLASQAFYSADEFMAFDWVTAHLEH